MSCSESLRDRNALPAYNNRLEVNVNAPQRYFLLIAETSHELWPKLEKKLRSVENS